MSDSILDGGSDKGSKLLDRLFSEEFIVGGDKDSSTIGGVPLLSCMTERPMLMAAPASKAEVAEAGLLLPYIKL